MIDKSFYKSLWFEEDSILQVKKKSSYALNEKSYLQIIVMIDKPLHQFSWFEVESISNNSL